MIRKQKELGITLISLVLLVFKSFFKNFRKYVKDRLIHVDSIFASFWRVLTDPKKMRNRC